MHRNSSGTYAHADESYPAQVGGILKYTRPAWWRGPVPDSHRYLMKKPGYYLSEEVYCEVTKNYS